MAEVGVRAAEVEVEFDGSSAQRDPLLFDGFAVERVRREANEKPGDREKTRDQERVLLRPSHVDFEGVT